MQHIDHHATLRRDPIRPPARRCRAADQFGAGPSDIARHPPHSGRRPGPQGASPSRDSPRHVNFRSRWPQGCPRPRIAAAGLRRRVPPVRARGARRGRFGGNRGRLQDHHPPVQDRSGRPRRDDRDRARRRDVPREGRQGAAAGRQHQRWPTVPARRQGRPAWRSAAHRQERARSRQGLCLAKSSPPIRT
jgi:hypothetical protein